MGRLPLLIFILSWTPALVYSQVDFKHKIRIPVALGLDAFGSEKTIRAYGDSAASLPYNSDYLEFSAREAEIVVIDPTTIRLSFLEHLRWDVYSTDTQEFLHHKVLKSILIKVKLEEILSLLQLQAGLMVAPNLIDSEWLQEFNAFKRPTDYDEYVKIFNAMPDYWWVKLNSLSIKVSFDKLSELDGTSLVTKIYGQGDGLNHALEPIAQYQGVSIALAEGYLMLEEGSTELEGYRESMKNLLARQQEIESHGWTLGLYEQPVTSDVIAQGLKSSDNIVSLSEFRLCREVFKAKE